MVDRTSSIIEDKIQALPLIDAGALEIISLLNDPNSSYDKIIKRLSPDVAAQFLNTANSAYYGREVRSIGYAVSLLGFSKMKQILITSFLLDHFTKHLDFKDFSFEKFHSHAHFCASVTQAIGNMLQMKNQEDLYTVSILHKIGKLIIAAYFKDELKNISKQVNEGNLTDIEAETQVLGKNHAEIGALALKRYKIAEDICDAIRYHVTPRHSIPEGSNFQLELLLRKSFDIVEVYQIPNEKDLAIIGACLQESVPSGQNIVRSSLKSGIFPYEKPADFMQVLGKIEPLMHDTLMNNWHEAACFQANQVPARLN